MTERRVHREGQPANPGLYRSELSQREPSSRGRSANPGTGTAISPNPKTDAPKRQALLSGVDFVALEKDLASLRQEAAISDRNTAIRSRRASSVRRIGAAPDKNSMESSGKEAELARLKLLTTGKTIVKPAGDPNAPVNKKEERERRKAAVFNRLFAGVPERRAPRWGGMDNGNSRLGNLKPATTHQIRPPDFLVCVPVITKPAEDENTAKE